MRFRIIRHKIRKKHKFNIIRICLRRIVIYKRQQLLHPRHSPFILVFILDFCHNHVLLDGGTINAVIFRVGADKTNIDKLWPELNNNHKPVIVAFYIKNIVLIAYIIDRIECLSDV